MSGLIVRFFSLILAATSAGVTLVLVFVGYEVALMVMAGGHTSGQMSMVVLGVLPSLFALMSAPFWLTLQRMRRQGAGNLS
jgi:hypothetical protein